MFLYEDNHLLVLNKPCGLATMGVGPDEPSVARQAAQYIKQKYAKPGNVYVGVVSRLDAMVSGVLVLARTSKAAARLSDQIRNQATKKRYVAIVEGDSPWTTEFTKLEHELVKSESKHRMLVVPSGSTGAQHAVLFVRLLAVWKSTSIVEIELVTGRKHQIRVQLAASGHPILGDKKYGSERDWPQGIALHCYQVQIEHPTQRQPMTFNAMPEHWQSSIGAANYADLCRQLKTRSSL